MPQTLAVIDRTNRSYPGTRTIGTPAELREFALAHVGTGHPALQIAEPDRRWRE